MKSTTLSISKFIGIILLSLLSGVLIALIICAIYYDSHPKYVYVNFEIKEEKKEYEWKYKMLPPEMSDYITELCNGIELDSDLPVAHLLVENPNLDPLAEHKNPNGTYDQGLFQLNSRSQDTVFINAYWPFDIEFDPFNWKMNTYIAIMHIKDLNSTFVVQSDAICAYNCGSGRVIKDDIPEMTYRYLAAVNNNLVLLKGAYGNEG